MSFKVIYRVLFFILYLMGSFLRPQAQQIKNPDFSSRCDSSGTGVCFWDLSWGSKQLIRPENKNGKIYLLIEGMSEADVGFLEQSVPIPVNDSLRIITIKAMIQADSIKGKGAGINLGLYDSSGNFLLNKDMGDLYSIDWIKGTHGWKDYSISIVCPPGATKMKIGAILYGKGKASFSSYRIKFLGVEGRTASALAAKYIAAACDTIRIHSLVRDSINIESLKKKALEIAGDAHSYGDCTLAMNFLVESLRPFGDEHSFFMPVKEVKNWEAGGSEVSKVELPSFNVIDQCGYILVPPFHSGNKTQMHVYADSLQHIILNLSEKGIRGWIIDLRENTGGNMEPMIAGLGPLFSSKKLGSLVDVNKKQDSWYYENGRYFTDSDPGWQVSHPVSLKSRLPIAVLTEHQTGSSGEIVTLSFVGNANTKSFGGATWGLTTGNGSFDLIDGSRIYLASTVMADRSGKEYHGSVPPDFAITEKKKGPDLVIQAALSWIKSF